MRYTAALVLSTLAIGQAAAVNNKHASFHARRQENQKRTEYDLSHVNWSEALKNVQWSTVSYGKGAPATPSPAAPSSAAGYKPAATTPVAAAAAYTSAPAAASSASSPKSSSKADAGNVLNIATDLTSGVSNILGKFGIQMAANGGSTSKSAPMYIGDDGNWKATFTNSKSEDVVLVCWTKEGMWINASPPLITLKLSKGQSKTISFNDNTSGGCGPMYSSTGMNYGMLWNTIFEFTFKNSQTQAGGFDISREVYMNGDYISAKGSTNGCFSDNENCVFKCTSGDTCGQANTYELVNKGSGCNGSKSDGSCEIPATQSSEHVQVTFN